jgi:oxygen-independent coproporphyrinogen-3 oxidase
MKPTAVYIHIPFCPSKCGYCDFNSFAMSGSIIDRTVEAIRQEVLSTPFKGVPAKTIFFGGGTPTFIPVEGLISILDAVRKVHPPAGDIEITSEANPGTVDQANFNQMVEAGFNRVSLGAQSFDSGDLIQLGRVHASNDIARAVATARSAGFQSLNLDLIFAVPGQSMRGWKKNVETALSLKPDHLSLYALTLEPNTRFYRYASRGMLDLPDDEAQTQMYDFSVETAEASGLSQYEISNFSKPGHESQHNICYWRSEPYFGYGPGAVGCAEIDGNLTRWTCMKHPERYSALVEENKPTWFEQERLTAENLQLERVMMGLRLNEGIPADWVEPAKIEAVAAKGWIKKSGEKICLSSAGRHFCSSAVLELI